MIHLRPFTLGDENIMLDILTDNRIKQTYMLPDFNQKQDASPLFRRLMALSLDEKHFVRGICLNNDVIGFLNDVETDSGIIELGYVIHPHYQCHGYMTQALAIAMEALFSLGYQEVVAGAFEENVASIRVMERTGMAKMEKADEIEYRGTTHRCVYYSKKKPE